MPSRTGEFELKKWLATLIGSDRSGQIAIICLLRLMEKPLTMKSVQELNFWEMKSDYLRKKFKGKITFEKKVKGEITFKQLDLLRNWLIHREHFCETEYSHKYSELIRFFRLHKIEQAGQLIAIHLLIQHAQKPTADNFLNLKPDYFTFEHISRIFSRLPQYRVLQSLRTLQSLRNLIEKYQIKNDSDNLSDRSDKLSDHGNDTDSSTEAYESDEEETPEQFKQNPYMVKIPRPSQPPPRPARARRSQCNDQSRG